MDINATEMQRLLLNWYDTHARSLPWRDDPTPYRVWISEIMLQQTRVETVKPYFDRFLAELPTVRALAEADEQVLLKLWEGLGYYSRARNLKKAAAEILESHGGHLPSSAAELVKLPGIGPYSAGAIASIAFGVRTSAIDGNVLRVIARITANRGDLAQKETKEAVGKTVEAILPETRVGDFNQALMELGATVCLPNGEPRCDVCPVQALCISHLKGITGEIPVKNQKKARRIEKRTILIIRCSQRTAIVKRPNEGLLQGLWEFPNREGFLSPQDCEKLLQERNFRIIGMEPLPKSKHIFTHLEWHMTGYLICAEECETKVSCPSEYEDYIWATPEELRQSYTIPTAFKAYLPYALGNGC